MKSRLKAEWLVSLWEVAGHYLAIWNAAYESCDILLGSFNYEETEEEDDEEGRFSDRSQPEFSMTED